MSTSKRTAALQVLCWFSMSLLLMGPGRRQQPGTAIVTGTAVDPGSMTPLPQVTVSWKSRRATSDRTGRFEIDLPAGIRELSFSAPGRPAVTKIVIVRQPGSRVRQDVLLPASLPYTAMSLALRRDPSGLHGKDLDSDLRLEPAITVADEYGNREDALRLNAGRVHLYSPVWLGADTIVFGKEGIVHQPDRPGALGAFRLEPASGDLRQIASGIGVRFLSKAPHAGGLALANDKDLFVMDSLSSSPVRIFGLGANDGFLLSIAWGSDDRIYFTVDDRIQLDERHFMARSRIGRIRPDGAEYEPDWLSDPRYSYRYPAAGSDEELIYCRFAPDGTGQTLWSRNLRTGAAKPLFGPALRFVHLDLKSRRLYYIYRNELHLRDLNSGADWVIVNSIEEADYVRSGD